MDRVTTAVSPSESEPTGGARSNGTSGRSLAVSLMLTAFLVAALLPLVANAYQTHLLVLVAIYALLGIGYNIALGFAGLLSLGHNAFIGIGAYAAVLFVRDAGVSPVAALLGAALAGGLLSLFYGVVALRLDGAGFVIVTLALGGATELIAVNWGTVTGGPSGITDVPVMTVFGFSFGEARAYYYFAATLMALALAMAATLRSMRIGRAWAAIRENSSLASAVGIDRRAYSLAAFVLSGIVVALGGALLAFYQQYVSPEVMNFSQVLLLLMVVIVGGVGSWAGPVIGAALIVLLQEYLRALDPWQYTILGAVLVVVILVKPGGLYEILVHDLPKAWSRAVERVSMGRLSVRQPRVMPVARRLKGAGSQVRDGREVTCNPEKGARRGGPKQGSPVTPNRLGPELLAVRGLNKSFGGVHAVQDVSFSVHEGEVVSLIGPNGAGKTTTFDMVNGALVPSSGDIRFGDDQIAGLPRHEIAQHGVVGSSQESEVFGDLSVHECIQIGMHLQHQSGRRVSNLYRRREHGYRRRVAIADILHLVGLEHRADVAGNALAYGEKRRLGVGVALSANPRLLLLDEPMAGLNGVEVEDMLHIFWSLRATGTTILLIDHDLKAVMRVSDRVIVLDQGKVIADGSPRSVVADPAVVECYIGEATTA